jgi:hypothetical protein
MASDICLFCRGRNGEHKAGCSAPHNVAPLPNRNLLTVMNASPHHLAIRATVDPLVFEVICAHRRDEAPDELLKINLLKQENGEHRGDQRN